MIFTIKVLSQYDNSLGGSHFVDVHGIVSKASHPGCQFAARAVEAHERSAFLRAPVCCEDYFRPNNNTKFT
jgi:hypothetical protein